MNRKPLRQRPIATKEGGPTTFRKLSRQLERLLPAEPWQATVACAAAARKHIAEGHIGIPDQFSVWQLGGLAIGALNRDGVRAPPERTELNGLSIAEFDSLMTVASGLGSKEQIWASQRKQRQA